MVGLDLKREVQKRGVKTVVAFLEVKRVLNLQREPVYL